MRKLLSKRLSSLKSNLSSLILSTRQYRLPRTRWTSSRLNKSLRWISSLLRKLQLLTRELRISNGTTIPRSNQNLLHNRKISMFILNLRSFGPLRTKRLTSLLQFKISEKNSAPNFLLPNCLYRKNFKLSQMLFGLLSERVKISPQKRATESAESSMMRPMPSEMSSIKELRLQPKCCPKPQTKKLLH